MSWLRIREKFNSGPGQWEYLHYNFVVDDDFINEFRYERDYNYYTSETYRGCDIERIAICDVPRKEIEKHIAFADSQVKYYTESRTLILKELLEHQLEGVVQQHMQDDYANSLRGEAHANTEQQTSMG